MIAAVKVFVALACGVANVHLFILPAEPKDPAYHAPLKEVLSNNLNDNAFYDIIYDDVLCKYLIFVHIYVIFQYHLTF